MPEKPKRVKLTHAQIDMLRPGPIIRPQLDAFMTAWARRLFARAGRYACPTFEQWELEFLRELHPEKELFVWEVIATACEQYRRTHPRASDTALVGHMAGISIGARLGRGTPDAAGMRAAYRRAWEQLHGHGKNVEATLRRLHRELLPDEPPSTDGPAPVS